MAAGFEGFVPFGDLQNVTVPKRPGVYVVLLPGGTKPNFLPESQAGRHNGKDPTIPMELLRSRWVEGSEVVYIGKAGGESIKATLSTRISQYRRFGLGRSAGHWGGRAIFQIPHWEDLLVAWLPDNHPSDLETSLLREFKVTHRARPFANMKD